MEPVIKAEPVAAPEPVEKSEAIDMDAEEGIPICSIFYSFLFS